MDEKDLEEFLNKYYSPNSKKDYVIEDNNAIQYIDNNEKKSNEWQNKINIYEENMNKNNNKIIIHKHKENNDIIPKDCRKT